MSEKEQDIIVEKVNGLQNNLQDNFWSYFEEGEEGESDKKEFPTPFFQIIGILAEDCDYNLYACYSDGSRLFVKGNRGDEQNELMLRYGRVGSSLVVARVEFINRRQGKMTELLRILKAIQKRYGIEEIKIESVLTDEMKQWCKKNGFKKEEDSRNYYIR